MNQISLTLLGGGLALVIWSSGGQGLERTADLQSPDPGGPGMVRSYTETDSDETIRAYCVRCHNERMLRGNLSLESFEMSASHREGQTAEKMIRKLRAGMMPPPGARRPAGDTLLMLVASLEAAMDLAAAEDQVGILQSRTQLHKVDDDDDDDDDDNDPFLLLSGCA